MDYRRYYRAYRRVRRSLKRDYSQPTFPLIKWNAKAGRRKTRARLQTNERWIPNVETRNTPERIIIYVFERRNSRLTRPTRSPNVTGSMTDEIRSFVRSFRTTYGRYTSGNCWQPTSFCWSANENENGRTRRPNGAQIHILVFELLYHCRIYEYILIDAIFHKHQLIANCGGHHCTVDLYAFVRSLTLAYSNLFLLHFFNEFSIWHFFWYTFFPQTLPNYVNLARYCQIYFQSVQNNANTCNIQEYIKCQRVKHAKKRKKKKKSGIQKYINCESLKIAKLWTKDATKDRTGSLRDAENRRRTIVEQTRPFLSVMATDLPSSRSSNEARRVCRLVCSCVTVREKGSGRIYSDGRAVRGIDLSSSQTDTGSNYRRFELAVFLSRPTAPARVPPKLSEIDIP